MANHLSIRSLTGGLKTGLEVTWSLAKITFPVTFLVGILKYTFIIEFLTELITPIMGLFGLPGESVIAFVLGGLLNIYAAIGAILATDLTVKQVFILAMMISMAHNLIVETAITTKMGVSPLLVALIRLGMAFALAFIINLVWQGGQETAQYGLMPSQETVPEGWGAIAGSALQTAFLGLLQMTMIIIPIMIIIRLMKDLDILSLLVKILSPVTRVLGISEKNSLMLLAGILFGIAYGAGIMIQAAKEENLSRRDIYLVSIFLLCCHAVVEDTLIFLPLGINVLPLLLIRLLIAFLVTILTSRVWRRINWEEEESSVST